MEVEFDYAGHWSDGVIGFTNLGSNRKQEVVA